MTSWATYFSESIIKYPRCTSSEDRLCDIFKELPIWNESFWLAGFQLRELSPGQLSLVEVREFYDYNAKLRRLATKLLQHLLTKHRCLVSVELNEHFFKRHYQITCDALRRSENLRKVMLRLPSCDTNTMYYFTAVLPHMNHLRELELSGARFSTSVKAFSEFLANTRSLVTLNITDQDHECWDVVAILDGLMRNTTITTLSLNTSLLRRGRKWYGDDFADYLSRNQTLRTLSVTSFYQADFEILDRILGALIYHSTLTKLSLVDFWLHFQNYELITGMLRQNRTLRILRMESCFCCHYDSDQKKYARTWRCLQSLTFLWVAALAENKTLEELTLDVAGIWAEDFDPLFTALACHASLKKVAVNYEIDDVALICRAIQNTAVPERFSINGLTVSQDLVWELPECKALSYIIAESRFSDGLEPLHTTLCLLPSCGHVRSLSLAMNYWTLDSYTGSLMIEYIANTTTLRELDLEFSFRSPYYLAQSKLALLQALSLNKSIHWLRIIGLGMNETHTQMLVDTILSSRMLCHLTIDREEQASLARMLLPHVSGHYTLLSLSYYQLERYSGNAFAVQDVLRRNNELVTRAAHFVKGTRHKHCAAAAELVHFSHGLVKEVQELARVDEDEAVSRIKISLKSFRELDDFMCLAGVVKYGVSCHRREDGQKQLVNLNRDCWLHIRQLLKVGDILDSKMARVFVPTS
ncbi:hypothetical protein MTO96_051238 [Rhipicephalus appendiculatus]